MLGNAALVRALLAERLRLDVADISLTADLFRDLGLAPLDLVLVALRVEDALRVRCALSKLERVRTVGELVAMLDEAAA